MTSPQPAMRFSWPKPRWEQAKAQEVNAHNDLSYTEVRVPQTE